jgi:ketosteroid isomerase-like protein
MKDPTTRVRLGISSAVVLIPVLVALALAACASPVYGRAAKAQIGGIPKAQKGGMPRAQKHESRHEIDQLEDTWRDAVLKGNIAALDSLLADDYMAISPNGTLQSKEQTLEHVRSGAIHFTSIEFSDRKVRFYGTTALVTSRAEVSGANAEGVIDGSFRYTRVYVRDVRGNWKIVSFEASRIREPGEPR